MSFEWEVVLPVEVGVESLLKLITQDFPLPVELVMLPRPCCFMVTVL